MSPARLYQDGRVDGVELAIKELSGYLKQNDGYHRSVIAVCIAKLESLKRDTKAEAKLGRTLLKGKA